MPRNIAERDNDLENGHGGNSGFQERPARRLFVGQGRVARRRAQNGIGNAAIDKPQIVAAVVAIMSFGPAGREKDLEQDTGRPNPR